MDKKRFFGFILVLSGVLLALSRVALTGAVIGETKSSMLGVVAAALTLGGIILISVSYRKEGYRASEEAIKEIDRRMRIRGELAKRNMDYDSLSDREKMMYQRTVRKHDESEAKERRYLEGLAKEIGEEPEKVKYLENEATEYLIKRRTVPVNVRQLARIATASGYTVVPDTKEGNSVYNSMGVHMTDLTGHREMNRNTARAALISMATGKPQRKSHHRAA